MNYSSQYKEIEIIGRGNSGSATIVQNLMDSNYFVAKKMLLGNMKKKEQDNALNEVNPEIKKARLLKEFRHPNIVGYIDSFVEDGVLIIIMEYCEEGDLAYHIKRKKEQGEYFPEKLILNWFLQIALALKHIHDRKILHRDIKTSNIFLTFNGTVKIGDFGISKLLDNTNDHASTVVGTPYYMSPEVCQSKPYTYKSDVWALGCVLFELCTLKHAFYANNLLGLVYKIVKEGPEQIPSIYSQELSTLCCKLLVKEEKNRPFIWEIFSFPYICRIMQEFVDLKGMQLNSEPIPIKKTLAHTKQQTPQEAMQMRKEARAKEKEELMKNAIRKQKSLREEHKSRKNQELRVSNTSFGFRKEQSKPLEDHRSNSGEKKQLANSMQTIHTNIDFSNTDEYNEEFEEYLSDTDSDKTRFTQRAGERELQEVINVYKDQLTNPQQLTNPKKDFYLEEIMENSVEEGTIELKRVSPQEEVKENAIPSLANKIEQMKVKCQSLLGVQAYEKVYTFVKSQKREGVDDVEIHNKLKEMIGRKNISACFFIDQIIYMEESQQ